MNAEISKIKSATFLAVLIGITALFLYVIGGLLLPVFYGIVFALVLFPYHARLTEKIGRPSLSAVITIFFAIIVLAAISYLVGGFILRDAVTLVNTIGEKAESISAFSQNLSEKIKLLLPTASERLAQIDFKGQVAGILKKTAEGLLAGISSFTSNFAGILALALITFYATFYFLRDGKNWAGHFMRIFPLGDSDLEHLSARFVAMVRTSLRMVFIMGAVQGFLGGLIFAMLGITAPFFWGLMFALVSLIPGLGHFLIWLPTAVILFAMGSPIKALVLIVYGLVVMGMSDDLLRPYLIGRKVKIHPFLILIATIGGIATFGFTGLILGPVIASLTMAVWELYETKYGA